MLNSKGIIIWVITILVILPAKAQTIDWHSMSQEEVITATKEKVIVSLHYRLGAKIDVELPMEKAALLTVEPNPHGLKEVILCPYDCEGPSSRPGDRGALWHNLVFDDGYSRTHGKFLRAKSMLQSYGAAPDLGFDISWEIEGGKVFIKYRALSGKEKLFEIRKTWRKPESNFISQEDRVTAFAQLWSEVKYNFVFFDNVPELDWNSVLEEYMSEVLKEQSRYEFGRLLQKLVAKLRDGHTSVYFGGYDTSSVCYDYLPLRVKLINEKIIIIEPGTGEQILQAGLKTGDEITHIDGRHVQEILKGEVYPYIFASTLQDRDRQAFERRFECSKGPVDSKARLRIRSVDGQVREVVLTRRTRGNQMPWLRRPESDRWFEYKQLEEAIAYVRLGHFGSKDIIRQFDEIFGKIQTTEGLIIDVRENGGGSTSIGDAIISYLTDKPLQGSHWKTRQYIPAFRAWAKEQQWYEGDHDPITPRKDGAFLGPVVVLTGPETGSAAEDFVVALHASGRATVVGERTRGSTGQPLLIKLPGGGNARICTKWDTYPDGREFVGVGIIPDVKVHPTPDDIANGRDIVLEKGISTLKAKIM